MKTKLFIFPLALALLNCSSGENTDQTLDEKIEDMIPRSDQEPCDFLSLDEIKETFSLDQDIKVTQNNDYGICSYSWEIASEKTSEEDNINAILNAAKTGNIANAVSGISQGYYSVGFNFSTIEASTGAEAKAGYERIIKRLSEGIKVSKETVSKKMEEMGLDSRAAEEYLTEENLTYKNDQWTEVNGVGDAATWSSKTNQLTVLSGTDVFFLTVKAGDKAKSQEMAEKLAAVIIDNL